VPQVRGQQSGHDMHGDGQRVHAVRRAGPAQRDMRPAHRGIPGHRRRGVRPVRVPVQRRDQDEPAVGQLARLHHHGRRAQVPAAAQPARARAQELRVPDHQVVLEHIQARGQPAVADHRAERQHDAVQQSAAAGVGPAVPGRYAPADQQEGAQSQAPDAASDHRIAGQQQQRQQSPRRHGRQGHGAQDVGPVVLSACRQSELLV